MTLSAVEHNQEMESICYQKVKSGENFIVYAAVEETTKAANIGQDMGKDNGM